MFLVDKTLLLKLYFWWVWAPGDNTNEISIWRQFFGRELILEDFSKISIFERKQFDFWKFQIFKNIKHVIFKTI